MRRQFFRQNVQNDVRMCKTSAVNLTVIKRVLCGMTEKEQADVVLSRKAFSQRCCLKDSPSLLNHNRKTGAAV